MTYDDLKLEDSLALAEAYRVYELLNDEDKERIPEKFVEILFSYGDLSLVGPLDPSKSLKEFNLSKRGRYLVMYMCTLRKIRKSMETAFSKAVFLLKIIICYKEKATLIYILSCNNCQNWKKVL